MHLTEIDIGKNIKKKGSFFTFAGLILIQAQDKGAISCKGD